jgi:hypothetical protein
VPLPMEGFISQIAKGGRRSIPLVSVEATESALGLLPSVGPWAVGKARKELWGICCAGDQGTGRVCSGAQVRARFSSVAPGYVIKTVVTPAAAR